MTLTQSQLVVSTEEMRAGLPKSTIELKKLQKITLEEQKAIWTGEKQFGIVKTNLDCQNFWYPYVFTYHGIF